jgi:pimeloyl-ACP methyl ester carboxylesterase
MMLFRNIAIGFLITVFFANNAHATRRPVIIVPGVMGSKLCDAKGNVVWGDRYSYTMTRLNLFRLPPDVSKRDASIHSCGLIDDINIIPLFWDAHVYDQLIEFLKGIGYHDSDIFKFDYDWRLSNFDNADLLASYIERIGAPDRVDLIAHSMGGLIARIYFQNKGGSDKINNLIMIGTPHLGSAQIFQRLKDGFDNWPPLLSGGIINIQTTILSFPSSYQLLPTYDECCGFSPDGNPSKATYFDILDDKYWPQLPVPDDFKTGGYSGALADHLEEARKLRDLTRLPITQDPQTWPRIHFIGNGFLDTWSRVFFDPSNGRITGHASNQGDGTVLLFSSTNGVPAQVQLALREHAEVFAGREPELVMSAALSGRRWTKGSTDFDQDVTDADGKSVLLHGCSLEITPRVTAPSQTVNVVLACRGDDDISTAKLTNLRFLLFSNLTTLGSVSYVDSTASPNDRTFSGNFLAPDKAGPYGVKALLPGMEPLSAMFAVITP